MGAGFSVEEIHVGSANVAVFTCCALQMPPFPPGYKGFIQI